MIWIISIVLLLVILGICLKINYSKVSSNVQCFDRYCCLKDSPHDCWIPGELAVQFNEEVSGEQAMKIVQDMGLTVSPLTALQNQNRNARVTIINLPKGDELDYSDSLNKTGMVKSISLSRFFWDATDSQISIPPKA